MGSRQEAGCYVGRDDNMKSETGTRNSGKNCGEAPGGP